MEKQTLFTPADILLPRGADLTKWSVIACDQYTSQPDYWQGVAARVEDAPSTLHMIYPEVWLEQPDRAARIGAINRAMESTMARGLLEVKREVFLYVERTLPSGRVRRGLMGKLDLEAYDYSIDSRSPVRPTEGTVESRLPPRIKIREHAPLELPHIMVLADDPEALVIEPLARLTTLQKAYEFPLGEDGGTICGKLVEGRDAERVTDALTTLFASNCRGGEVLSLAVGDGNHSLATARACYEQLKKTVPESVWRIHPARWALVELVNIHDPALTIAPIHRLVTGCDPSALLAALQEECGASGGKSTAIPCVTAGGTETLTLSLVGTASGLAVEALQGFLDRRQAQGGQFAIDYIHGDEALKSLARQPGAVGFLLPAMEKNSLFPTVREKGALPRKTFSLGEAWEKRYYLEARSIRCPDA